MKFLNFLESFFYRKYKHNQNIDQHKENIFKLLQWGNYSEVNNDSLSNLEKLAKRNQNAK